MNAAPGKKLAFIGDSLTEYFDWEARFPSCGVVNLGISGETVEELVARADRIFLAVKDPDFIFLMTGTNNVAMERYEINRAYRELLEKFTKHYRNAVIAVQSIPPMKLPWIEDAAVQEANRKLEALAREFRTEFLDVYSLFFGPGHIMHNGLLLEDGVHLSRAGYEVWSQAVEDFINTLSRPS